MPANLKSSAVVTGLEKVSFHFNVKERQWERMFKLPHIAFISEGRKVMLKILHSRFQLDIYHELPEVQAGFRKGRGPKAEIILPTSVGSSEKQESSRKTPTSALLTT